MKGNEMKTTNTKSSRENIIKFLQKNHKNFDRLDAENFDAWQSAWEDSEAEGYAHIEITSHDSISGHTELLD